MTNNQHLYVHKDSSINTVGGFVNQGTSPAKSFIGKVSSFLDIKDENEIIGQARGTVAVPACKSKTAARHRKRRSEHFEKWCAAEAMRSCSTRRDQHKTEGRIDC